MICALLLTGCIAQQADLKQTEKNLQQRIKQSSDESAQTRATTESRDFGASGAGAACSCVANWSAHCTKAQELQGKQEDLKQRSAQLEQQTKRLEQLAGKLEADSTTRYNQVRESLNAQDVKNKQDRDQLRIDVNTRLDDVSRQMEVVRKEIIGGPAEDEQRTCQESSTNVCKCSHKALVDNQASGRNSCRRKNSQQSQSVLNGTCRDSLTGLKRAVEPRKKQASKASATHINETKQGRDRLFRRGQ